MLQQHLICVQLQHLHLTRCKCKYHLGDVASLVACRGMRATSGGRAYIPTSLNLSLYSARPLVISSWRLVADQLLIIIQPVINHTWIVIQIMLTARPPVMQPVASCSLIKITSKF